MVCGLFSSFDPGVVVGSIFFHLKWMSFVFIVGGMGWLSFLSPLGSGVVFKSLSLALFQSVKDLFKKSAFKVFGLLLSIFSMILFFNILGMLPYSFSISSHLSVNLSISLGMWMGGIMYLVFNSPISLISHLVPMGSPALLWPLLVMVESVSLVIRPFTLAIRLMANVMAGHLIMSLIGDSFSKSLLSSVSPLGMGGFLMFEIAVSVVQAYVFVNLMSLYWEESEHFFSIMNSKHDFQSWSP